MKSLNTPKGTKKIGTETPLKSPRKESIPRPSAVKTKAAHVSELLEEMRADLSPILPQQFGNFPLDESMLCSRISADQAGNLEHAQFNFLSDENLNNLISASPGGPYRRLLEEYSILKKELELKSGLVERVMKENKNLRRELEEFLSTVEEARSHIDVELKEFTNRIIDLEAEIQDLRNENKLYKEQLQAASLADTSRENEKEKAIIETLEGEVDGYYESSRKEFENFYFRLNEQIVEFMDASKKQYQDFQVNLHQKMTEVASSPTAVKTKNIPAPISTSRNSSMRRDPDVASPARSVKPGLNRLSNSRTTAAPTKSRLSSVDSKTAPKMPTSTSATTNKKILSKQNANHSSTELHHQGLSYTSSKRKLTLTNSSIGLLETESGNLSGFTVPDSKGNLLGNSTVSPKSTILNAKMRSDALLQEMKRKLAEVTGSHA